MKSIPTMKAAMIACVSATMFLASCHFDSDKDYKVYKTDSTEHGEATEAGDHGDKPAHDAAHEADAPGHHEEPAMNAASKDSAGKMDSSMIGKPDTSSTSRATRKGRATMTEWSVDNSAKKEMDAEGVYVNADVMPEYPGGRQAIQKFIEDNIRYPQTAMDEDVEGTVKVTFAVDESGKVYKATTSGSKIGYGLEQEALRVVNKMGKWTPGKVNGKNVKTRLTLPVVFLIS